MAEKWTHAASRVKAATANVERLSIDRASALRRRIDCRLTPLALALSVCFGAHALAAEVVQPLPIQPVRTLSISTTEGTDMNLSLSPDGRTLLFDLLGDLYVVPVSGGTAVQLTRGLAINTQPVWSPDGASIAYISDGSGAAHVNVRDFSGRVHRVLGERDPALDLEGTPHLLAWTPKGDGVIVGGGKVVLWGPYTRPLERAVQYDLNGQMSVYKETTDPLLFVDGGTVTYSLDQGHVFRTDGGKGTREPIGPGLNAEDSPKSPVLSSDTRWLAYCRDSQNPVSLILRNVITGAQRVLVPYFSSRGCPIPKAYVFTPDSSALFVSYGGRVHRIGIADGSDQRIPIMVNAKVDLGSFDYNTFRITYDPLSVKYTRSANESPDGRHVVFTALNRIYVRKLPDGKPVVLCLQPIVQSEPVYSPDGKWIAYVTWSDRTGGALWKVPAEGGAPQQLTAELGQYQRPAWSPDGNLIAVVLSPFHPKTTYDGRLETLPAGGGTARLIDDHVVFSDEDNSLAFSADGQRLIYKPKWEPGTQPHPGQADIGPVLVAKSLTDGRTQVLAVGTHDALQSQMYISPDGRFIAYSRAEAVYLLPVDHGSPAVVGEATRTEGGPEVPKWNGIRFSVGVDPHWEDDGRTLAWSYGSQFYRVSPEKILGLARAAKDGVALKLAGDGPIKVHAIPDTLVSLELKAPRLHAQGTVALKNVRVVSMRGNELIEQGTVVIQDGRFAAVGSASEVRIPARAAVFDLRGTTVIPGLVDLHLHMRLQNEIPPHPQQSWIYLANLAYGVTTARDPSSTYDSFGFSELLETGGMIGPRLFSVGRSLGPTYGVVMNEPSDAEENVGQRREMGAIYIKQYTNETRLQRQWVLDASRKSGANMTNEGSYRWLGDVAMIKDGSTGIEHNPVEGEVYQDLLSLIAQSGVYFTPTLQIRRGEGGLTGSYFVKKYWHDPDAKLMRFIPREMWQDYSNRTEPASEPESVMSDASVDARIRQSGGHVTLGSHGDFEGIGVHNELWALQMGGLTNLDALQAATIMGAEALGIQRDVGSIEVGKIADLIVLNKNPLDDIHNSREIRYIMKDGILYDGDTLNTVWPDFRKCPEWRLQGEAP